MPRKPRQFTDQFPYHVTCRCNNCNFYFRDHADFSLYLEILRKTQIKHPFSLYAYVIMSNHVHLIIQTTYNHPLNKVMQAINLTFTKEYNKISNRCGHLWMNRYNASLIMNDSYLVTSMRYVMRNPLNAGIVQSLDNWRWSSFHHYCSNKSDALITPAPLSACGYNSSERYRQLIISEWPSDTNLIQSFEKVLDRSEKGSDPRPEQSLILHQG